MHRNAEATEELKKLIAYIPIDGEAAMQLVRRGADPRTKNEAGFELIHGLVTGNFSNRNDAAIKELVEQYNVSIHTLNPNGFTPLQELMEPQSLFLPEDAITLLRLGANSNTKDSRGFPLIHRLLRTLPTDDTFKEFLDYFKGDVNALDPNGLTPLQRLMKNRRKYSYEIAMRLICLGANPYTEDECGFTVKQKLLTIDKNDFQDKDVYIEDLNKFEAEYTQKIYRPARNEFFNFLILLSHSPNSRFENFPIDVMLIIVAYLDLGSKKMGKTAEERVALAKTVLPLTRKEIKDMINRPGGMSVFQQFNEETKKPVFTFFKSVHTFCHDYDKLKCHLEKTQERKNPFWDYCVGKELTNTSITALGKFKADHALSCWYEHSSLYKKAENKQKLLDSIQNIEPYNSSEIKSKLNL